MSQSKPAGLWAQQRAQNEMKFRRQMKIRMWVVMFMVAFDFVCTFFAATFFVQDVSGGEPLWRQGLWFVVFCILLGWLRRDAARLRDVAAANRAIREEGK